MIHENPLAEKLCSAVDGLTFSSGMLVFADREAQHQFARAWGSLSAEDGLHINASERDFVARRPSGRRPYLVSLRPVPASDSLADVLLGAGGMLFVRDPETYTSLDTALLTDSYRLTPVETDLAVTIDDGGTLIDIANRRDVSVTTVRTQLYSLMAKLGVNRQVDLVRLLRQYGRPG